jgi:transposase
MTATEQFRIRKDIIRLSKTGLVTKKIAEVLGVSVRLVQLTKKTYREEGFAGISPGVRGRRVGEKRHLTPEQEKAIQRTIVDRNPEQLKLKCCLWTRRAIHDYIVHEFGLDLPLSTLGYYLARWGFSVQRPAKRARGQDAARIAGWMEKEYPAIEQQARREDCEIYWGDETAIQNTANYARGYAPIGKTPVLEVEAKKLKLNMLSAISNRGRLRFTISKEPVNTDILIDFMARLIRDSERKVLLILDNLRVHHSKKVTAWLAERKPEIELFYLPPYAPEYNPDEYLHSDLKRDMGKKPMPKSEKDLKTNARSFLKRAQLNPARIKSYFMTQYTKYAA